jgi:hypothetical protein
MLEFVPERVDRAVVMNVFQNQQPLAASVSPTSVVDSFVGADFVVAVHNWLIGTQLRYVIFDFQDEKDVPADFVEELMQLMKRMRIPFLFTGVMQRPHDLLKSYDYTSKFPIFPTSEEAITFLASKYPSLLGAPHDGIVFGSPIEMVRSRLNGKPGEEDGEVAADEED